MTIDTDEMESALAEARGAWAIIRKGRRDKPPTVRRFPWERDTLGGDADRARRAWRKLDVRQGWAVLVDPDGKTIESQSGPSLRTRW